MCVFWQLQAPSVKGFDFAKLHLGQHSKDDIMVIQEPGPMPAPIKEATPSDGGDLNTPKLKGSSTKVGRSSRRRGRSVTQDIVHWSTPNLSTITTPPKTLKKVKTGHSVPHCLHQQLVNILKYMKNVLYPEYFLNADIVFSLRIQK